MAGRPMFRSPAAEAIAGAIAAGSIFFGGTASAGFSTGRRDVHMHGIDLRER